VARLPLLHIWLSQFTDFSYQYSSTVLPFSSTIFFIFLLHYLLSYFFSFVQYPAHMPFARAFARSPTTDIDASSLKIHPILSYFIIDITRRPFHSDTHAATEFLFLRFQRLSSVY